MRHLQRDQTIRIEKKSGVSRIEVRRGAVWLTGTPGTDRVLHAGEQFQFPEEWPFVVQALAEAKIELVRSR